jgi:hypothetical protein
MEGLDTSSSIPLTRLNRATRDLSLGHRTLPVLAWSSKTTAELQAAAINASRMADHGELGDLCGPPPLNPRAYACVNLLEDKFSPLLLILPHEPLRRQPWFNFASPDRLNRFVKHNLSHSPRTSARTSCSRLALSPAGV